MKRNRHTEEQIISKQWDGVLPTLHRRRCATLVGENIIDQPEDEENSP